MKIAWNEIKYQPKKFILIELLITILMFMVVFLSGLTNGLGRSVSAQIDNYGSLHYILSTDSEGIIPFSTITAKDVDEVQKIEGWTILACPSSGQPSQNQRIPTLWISPTSQPIAMKKRSSIQSWKIQTSRSPT